MNNIEYVRLCPGVLLGALAGAVETLTHATLTVKAVQLW